MSRKIIALLFLLFIFSVSSVCAETINFGTASEYRPFVYYDFSDQLTGLDIDIINEVARREGFTLRVMDMAFDGLVDSVSVGQIDLIGGAFSKTAEREKALSLSNVYYSSAAIIVAAADSSVPDKVDVTALNGLRIGVQRGSSFDQWIKTNLVSEGLMNTQDIFTFATLDAGMKVLKNGSIDLVMLDNATYKHSYEPSGNFRIVNDTLAKEEYVFAAGPNAADLISKVNDGLSQMNKDGTLKALIDKYTQNGGEEAEITISRPSNIHIQPAAVPTPTPVPPINQPANCKNVMVFMSDVSYPDGSKVNPGAEFTKTWQIYNNGSCTWYQGYSVVFVDGDYMSANSAVVPVETIPGRTVDVPMKMKAPQTTGTYTGYYQLRAPDGTFFGPKLTAKIIVTEDQVSAPPVGASPVITQWQPNYYKGDNGFCPTIYWTVRNADRIHFSINNKRLYTTYYPSGSIMLCPRGGKGDYVYGIVAEGTKTVSYVFTYTNTGGGKKQPNYFPTALPPR